MAIVMTIVIVLWMASGMLFSDPDETSDSSANSASKSTAVKMTVQTRQQEAKAVQLTLTVQGQVEPEKQASLRPDISGRVHKLFVKEGEKVSAGKTLLTLDPEDRAIKLAKEKASLLSKQQQYERTQTLVKQGLQSSSDLEEAFAALKTAEASLAQVQLEMSQLTITAPFDGVIDRLLIEKNSYVSANSELGQFIDNSTLLVIAPVAQQDINKLEMGQSATVQFATGEQKEGTVVFISSLAKESTRTFRVEIAIDNSDRQIPAGISAEVTIPVDEIQGHFVSPAILALDANGEIGVKSVNENNRVTFTPVSIIKSSNNGVWVQGLPQQANIITVGQGFVDEGTEVNWEASEQEASNPAVVNAGTNPSIQNHGMNQP